MMKHIPKASGLTEAFQVQDELREVRPSINGAKGEMLGAKGVQIHEYAVLLSANGQNNGSLAREFGLGDQAVYRYSHLSGERLQTEYEGRIPASVADMYPGVDKVHLIYVEGEGRKDRFTDIPFP